MRKAPLKRGRFGFAKTGIQPKARTPLKAQSAKQKERLKKYNALRIEFLKDPANEWCRVCDSRREGGENITRNLTTEIHHAAGRLGENLFRHFIASCFRCRLFPHEHPMAARAMGLLV